jgi:hypothetical protein
MNETSAPFARGDNEFARAGLTMAECRLVAAPRVAESPAALECKVVEVIEIRSVGGARSGSVLTLGEVVAFHIDEAFLRDGRFDTVARRRHLNVGGVAAEGSALLGAQAPGAGRGPYSFREMSDFKALRRLFLPTCPSGRTRRKYTHFLWLFRFGTVGSTQRALRHHLPS